MRAKKILRDTAERLIVSKCPSCRSVVKRSGTLCEDCLGSYREEKERECEFCHLPATLCVCSTRDIYYCRQLKRSMYSILFYGSGNKVLSSVLKSLKYDTDRGAEKFLARELSAAILKLMAENGEFPNDWCITYPPRRRSAARRYGVDQSKGLAKRIARYTGMKFERTVARRGGAAQKTLGRDERAENAARSFMLAKGADVSGKKYVVVDDVITSGATMKTCQRILLSNGASAAFALSVAKTMMRGAGRDTRARFRKRASDAWFRSK